MLAKPFYKVVYSAGGNLLSCCLNYAFPHKARVKYKVGEFVKPSIKNTKLYVFKEYKDAQKFASKQYQWLIYTCEVKNPQICLEIPEVDYDWLMKLFDACEEGDLVNIVFAEIPKQETVVGAWQADEVKLINEISKY